MSKLTDALELAKAGFKAAEIKKMLEEKEDENKPKAEPKPAEEKEPEEKDPPAGDPPADPPAGDPEKDPPAGDPEPDQKYKELEDKYNDLLKKYQQTNVRQDISGNNEEKSVEEAARDVLAAMIGG